MSSPVRFAFSTAADGDLRNALDNRERFSERVGAPSLWAELHQVHGAEVVEATAPGDLGEGDALFTRQPGLALAVFIADCAGVIIEAEGGVGVAHAGWRGAAGGVVTALVSRMKAVGLAPLAAHLSPFIGPCCFEVGPEVAALFPEATAVTTGGALSVDLKKAVASQVPVPLVMGNGCTYHDPSFLSHRRMGGLIGSENVGRMAALCWFEPR